jgi:N-acetylglucosamine-6-phosphate deacetylase
MSRIAIDALTKTPFELQGNGTLREVTAAKFVRHWIAPGFIDLQVNGFGGVDFNQPDLPHSDIGSSIRSLYATGVTRFFPTVITGSPTHMLRALQNLAAAKRSLPEGVAIAGFHVEGPHISPEDGPVGAHPRNWVRPPDIDEFHRWQQATDNQVRIVTLAPEWPGATRYIESIVAEGVVAAIGHTNATDGEINEAVAAGATLSTHLGNGCHRVLPRHPNYIWSQLAEDRLMASFIVDGVHLPPSYVKVALRAKGIERSVLVTDASAPADARPGAYTVGEQVLELTADNRVLLAGQDKLAGSALKIHHGVENLMRLAGLSLRAAVTMATINPAKAGRIFGREHGLAACDNAELVLFDFSTETMTITVRETWLNGERVFQSAQA